MPETEEQLLFQEGALQAFCNALLILPPQFIWTQDAGTEQEHFLVCVIEQPKFTRYDLQCEQGITYSCALCPFGSLLLQRRRYFVYLLMPFVH
jgi:hypothetical protein